MGCCIGSLAKAQSRSDRPLRQPNKRNSRQFHSSRRRQWSSSPEAMDNNISVSYSVETNVSSVPPANEETRLSEEPNSHAFVNQAAIAWHEMRKTWIGDRSKKSHRATREPIISWCTTYEDLLSTNQRFPQPIPLSEMVDFLVDIWHEEGLYD